jgi:hypothetical protein
VIKFSKTLAKLASSSVFLLAKSEINWPQIITEKVSEREKKNSPDWRLGLYFYSPILNSTRIWRMGEWLSTPLKTDILLLPSSPLPAQNQL